LGEETEGEEEDEDGDGEFRRDWGGYIEHYNSFLLLINSNNGITLYEVMVLIAVFWLLINK
jgi:hypothetical protein